MGGGGSTRGAVAPLVLCTLNTLRVNYSIIKLLSFQSNLHIKYLKYTKQSSYPPEYVNGPQTVSKMEHFLLGLTMSFALKCK